MDKETVQQTVALADILKQLLPVMAGGLLTIAGNYFFQYKSRNAEKKKLYREKIEEMYVTISKLDKLSEGFDVPVSMQENRSNPSGAYKVFIDVSGRYRDECNLNLTRFMMFSQLYFPELHSSAKSFCSKYSDYVSYLCKPTKNSSLELEKYDGIKLEIKNECNVLVDSIAETSRKYI